MKNWRSFLFTTLLMLSFSPLVFSNNPENLLGLTLDYEKGEVTIHVISSGCTQKTDFKFNMKNDTLSVVRIRRDECKAMGSDVHFVYTLKEAGINPNKPFIIRNKFIANLFIANIN